MRTALVTGSTDAQGIGFTAAHLLASKHDFRIILSGRRPQAVDAAVQTLRERLGAEGSVLGLTMDVSDADSIASAVKSLSSSSFLGDGALDVLINNAGVGAPPGRGGKGTTNMFLQTEQTTAKDMTDVFSTNVAAVVEVTNALLPLLARSTAPRIVNVSSQRGSLTFESGLEPARTGAMVYNVSKSALNMVTVMQSKNLPAVMGRDNLKVNAASPGHVKTPFNNFTGIRTLEQGAQVYVHLATLPDDSLTGALIGDHAPFSTQQGNFVQLPW